MKDLFKCYYNNNESEVVEMVEFLDWLVKDNFILMGYCEYELLFV